jgi:hypothetical protein
VEARTSRSRTTNGSQLRNLWKLPEEKKTLENSSTRNNVKESPHRCNNNAVSLLFALEVVEAVVVVAVVAAIVTRAPSNVVIIAVSVPRIVQDPKTNVATDARIQLLQPLQSKVMINVDMEERPTRSERVFHFEIHVFQ